VAAPEYLSSLQNVYGRESVAWKKWFCPTPDEDAGLGLIDPRVGKSGVEGASFHPELVHQRGACRLQPPKRRVNEIPRLGYCCVPKV